MVGRILPLDTPPLAYLRIPRVGLTEACPGLYGYRRSEVPYLPEPSSEGTWLGTRTARKLKWSNWKSLTSDSIQYQPIPKLFIVSKSNSISIIHSFDILKPHNFLSRIGCHKMVVEYWRREMRLLAFAVARALKKRNPKWNSVSI